MSQLHAISAFQDNYIWLLEDGQHAIVVDPGDAEVVKSAMAKHDWQPCAILATHHHDDHIGGVEALLSDWDCPVYACESIAKRFPGRAQVVKDGDRFELQSWTLQVIATPGHTLDHLVYYLADPGILFSGDTLFSGGCGRLFEGSAAQMLASMDAIAALPDSTQICAAHEYTLANLAFALAVEPNNVALRQHQQLCQQRRQQGLPTLPSHLGLEKSINPFLRSDQPDIQAAVRKRGQAVGSRVEVFAEVRRWKDSF